MKLKKSAMFAKIQSREDALKLAKECGNGFFVVAVIQGGIGLFIAPSMLFDGLLFAVCGYFVGFKQSRIAAVVALILSGFAVVVTFLNRIGQDLGGGKNIVLALIIAFCAVRAVEATFKLHGRFKASPYDSASTVNSGSINPE